MYQRQALFKEIKEGMKKCVSLGKIPESMGIDTWAVDFVLLDSDNQVLGNAVGYRDDRTKGMDEKVYETISLEELYQKTGIQKQIFNTIYQLMAVKEETPELLSKAESMLMIPEDVYKRQVFVIAHRLSTVRNSKAIMVLEHGKIMERGSHEELLEQKGRYYKLYTGQFELE